MSILNQVSLNRNKIMHWTHNVNRGSLEPTLCVSSRSKGLHLLTQCVQSECVVSIPTAKHTSHQFACYTPSKGEATLMKAAHSHSFKTWLLDFVHFYLIKICILNFGLYESVISDLQQNNKKLNFCGLTMMSLGLTINLFFYCNPNS